ncbi:alginate lyase family protein [Mucilaginibacter sp. OK283]|jgi:hypothetical protein|uniref:alginate lyase family protein n=1 Tax=Mucilaginibacter sp. OK283 TaxID=1881049 RepID=UPI0008D49C7B|nr:alginate lyase family protein [Mucilaginibacter sp. OK283]SEP39610.1 Alginate lyase [Mucilaginibacter sp. OK283]
MPKKLFSVRYLVVVLIMAGVNASAQNKKVSGFLLQNVQQLSVLKKQYQAGDTAISNQIKSLLADADKELAAGPYSVTFHKTRVAPSGNPHDYVSQAPYWWADPSKPDGKPYIRKDGERNPEIYLLHDDSQLNDLCRAVKKLGFAYYFTGDEQYAQKAAGLMRTWFIDTATKMAPNFNYAQYIPGINDGRGIGIIESRALAVIPDALAMMQDSKSITADLKTNVKHWFAEYLTWLQKSKNGNEERQARNNHGTFYDVQVVDFALFTGNDKLAKEVLQNRTIARIDTQFTAEGRQPLELERTRSWSYSNMNLTGWSMLATLADRVDIDLWHTEKQGRGIKKCIEWIMPYLLKQKDWPYKQIEPISYGETLTICSLAEEKYPGIDFNKVFAIYPRPRPWGDDHH